MAEIWSEAHLAVKYDIKVVKSLVEPQTFAKERSGIGGYRIDFEDRTEYTDFIFCNIEVEEISALPREPDLNHYFHVHMQAVFPNKSFPGFGKNTSSESTTQESDFFLTHMYGTRIAGKHDIDKNAVIVSQLKGIRMKLTCPSFIHATYNGFITKGSLELEIFPSPLEISANEDALLMCKYDQPESDLTDIAVRWAFSSQTNQRDMYIFDGGNHDPKRTGAKMFDDDIRKGNASLYLPNVQFNEAGTYTCIVFVTPHKEEISSIMQVSVQPKVSVSALKVTTANGTGHFLACHVKEFYPEKVNISWLILTDGKLEYASKNQFTEDLVRNSDGTFSVSSKIRIEPTLDDRTKYRCVVKHKTFLGNFTLDADRVEGKTRLRR
ncbi:natural cytotoxicity triggering receptor 3 ligand 1-like [Scyliorhinus canicula]|uniref:natural cytotoxicity triggering receptor 3 ligand 1-like n=1 Tax=Scyliorhinus canicula TaxID=7830 RepID=UPI0018F2EB12|nr:natural cytotoxicity triggering receptor 3 ligand 1-like [Scyliorhinus canicula]